MRAGTGLLAASRALARRSIRGHGRIADLGRRLIADRYLRVPYLDTGSIWVCPGHTSGEDVHRTGIYEPQVIRAIQSFVRAGFSFVDVGANIGLHTVAAGMSRVSESQRFAAFEPEPRSFLLLRKNCDANGLSFVETLPAAVGSAEGTAELYVSTTFNQTHHGLVRHSTQVTVARCEVTTLDREFSTGPRRLDTPTLVKIDVEGTEPEVLRGGLYWLSESKPLAVICELSPVLLRRAGHTPQTVMDLLREIGCDRFLATDDNSPDPWRGFELPALGEMRRSFVNLLATRGLEARRLSEELTV